MRSPGADAGAAVLVKRSVTRRYNPKMAEIL
jgi:hypothetical protein